MTLHDCGLNNDSLDIDSVEIVPRVPVNFAVSPEKLVLVSRD